MIKHCLLFFTILALFSLQGQEQLLPPDFRQHNLTAYNSSFLSPVFALDRNNPESVALWTRWQWQTVDGDPTTLFLNYSRRLNAESAAGIGFFQNNTGVFLQTGGVLNYAYALDLESDAQIAFGLNLFGFVRELAESFQPNPNIGLPAFDETNDFVLRLSPSLRFKLDRFSIGIVAENLFDYNFTTSEKDTGPMEKVYIGLASYSFPITIFGSADESFIQPTVYMKTLPNYDNQFGFNALFSTPKFWVQTGYNNFYGLSGGAGARLFKRFSIGGIVEFSSSNELSGTDPTFELVTSYKLGKIESKKQPPLPEEEIEEEEPLITEAEQSEDEIVQDTAIVDKKEVRRLEKEAKLAERQARKDSLSNLRAEQKLASANVKAAEKERDSIEREQKRLNLIAAENLAQQRQDSIAKARENERLLSAEMEKEQRRADSISRVQKAAELAALREARQRTKDSLTQVKEQQRIAEQLKLVEQKRRDSLDDVRKARELAARRAAEQKTKDSIAEVSRIERLAEQAKIAAQKRKDSLDAVRKARELAARRAAEQKTKDSIAEVRRQERLAEQARVAAQKRKDSLDAVIKARELAARKAAEQKTKDSIAEVRRQERLAEQARVAAQKRADSLEAVKKAEALAAALKRKRVQDSIAQVAAAAEAAKQAQIAENEEAIQPQQGEKYEEAVTEDGLEPGFYLIANVFGTKKYFESFMKTLTEQGLRPRSFFRSLNKYNYVYLQRYDSISEARKARDSKFNGRYDGKTWIFRVVAN